MRILFPAAVAALLAHALPAIAVTPSEIVASAPADAWAPVPADRLMLMDIGGGRHIVILLEPAAAPEHVANIRLLVRQGWFNTTAINRVQENYVVQWGGSATLNPLPADFRARLPAEYEMPRSADFAPLPYRDSYAAEAGIWKGLPAASDGKSQWLAHCPGMVGVGRDMNPDTGNGAELYAVIGQAPRHLDRNIALVGRVVSGMEHLSALPRGDDPLGIYGDTKKFVPVRSVRMADSVPEEDRPHVAILRGEALKRWIEARANRQDDFFLKPAGAVDICNAMPPVKVN